MRLRCRVGRHTPFKPGKFYDVVEILEMPGHVMVRKPNGKWPKPGERNFGWHAEEWFEPAAEGIPAYTCGYYYVEEAFFGTVIPNSVFPVQRGPRLGELSATEERIDDLVQQCGGNRLWWMVYRNVLPTASYPKDLERQFLTIGANHDTLGRSYPYRSAERDIRTILRRLNISLSKIAPIEDQDLDFWFRSGRKAGPWNWTWHELTVDLKSSKA
jgi:hypothetical protein